MIITGDGTSLWTLTRSKDFAVPFVRCSARKALGDDFQITCDRAFTWDQIHEAIARGFGVKAIHAHVPTDTLVRYHKEWEGPLTGDKSWSAVFDNSKIKKVAGKFEASQNLDEILKQSVKHAKARLKAPAPGERRGGAHGSHHRRAGEAGALGGESCRHGEGTGRHDQATCAGKSVRGQLQPKEAPTFDRRWHEEPAGQRCAEAEALVVFRIADENDSVMAEHAGSGDGEPHESGADAFALRRRIDSERPEQQSRLAAGPHVPKADRADEFVAVAGDERQSTRRFTSSAEAFRWLQHAGRAHHAVEQGFPGAGFRRRLRGEDDHGCQIV